MKGVELYGQGLSRREAARRFGMARERWRRCWRFRCHRDTGGAGSRCGRSWTHFREGLHRSVLRSDWQKWL